MTEGKSQELTASLEDYLETIYTLIQEKKLARVRDICRARGVRAGSVSPAMRRLADMGLVKYEQREYIDLTEEGERQALKVLTRHRMLTRFLVDVLRMEPAAAELDACAMEHNMSDQAMTRLTRFMEFLEEHPDSGGEFLACFHDHLEGS